MKFPIPLIPKTGLLVLFTAALTLSLGAQPLYLDPTAGIEERVDDLLARMSLDEKIGQMTQANIGSVNPQSDVRDYFLGSVLSGGGEAPATNSPAAWADMTDSFQNFALATSLQIPLLYGVDAVHGHNNVYGATIFPHNIGLGATRNLELVRQAAEITAIEVAATGAHWTFSPAVSVARNEWWGRTYESFSEEPSLVSEMGVASLNGYQGNDLTADTSILATIKHFVGDGGTMNGDDQGNTIMSEEMLREIHLVPYIDAIAAGARTIMVSYSSWNGVKLHGHEYLLNDVLKVELGFDGLLLSDWAGVDQVDGNYAVAVRTAINAGIDMVMVPYDYVNFINTLRTEVNTGQVSMARIDDAVRRILRVKFEMGLFENPYAQRHLLPSVGSAAHRAVARQTVAESLVILKNENQLLPLAKDVGRVHVAGKNADNLGHQCGGWTISWQGGSGQTTIGTTIRQAIENTVSPSTAVTFSENGTGAAGADVGIVVIGETPYSEGVGDDTDLSLDPADITAINNIRNEGIPVVVILVSGRPMYIESQLPDWDVFIAAWLPGTEGQGVADVLFGDVYPTGTLSHSWPKNYAVPSNVGDIGYNPLFPFGFSVYLEGDMDNDSLTDLWEMRNGLNPYDDGTSNPAFGPSGDPDADGGNNRYEFESGTDPQSAASIFKVVGLDMQGLTGGMQAAVTVTTVPEYRYTIEFSSDPGNPLSWTPFANQQVGIGTWIETGASETTFTFIDDFSPATSGNADSSRRFYRVRTGPNVLVSPEPLVPTGISASHTFPGQIPELAIDQNLNTRWESPHGMDNVTLTLDFGSSRQFTSSEIYWETAAASHYQLHSSEDGLTWTLLLDVTNGFAGLDTREISGSGRYLRMTGLQRTTVYGYSIWEWQVFGF